MIDTDAWKPFALLLVIFLIWFGSKVFTPAIQSDTAITTNEPGVAITFNAGAVIVFGIVAFLVTFVIIAMMRSVAKDKQYVRPQVRYVSKGVVEVIGDVDKLQRESYRIGGINITQWEHVGHKKWHIVTDNLNDYQTKKFAEWLDENSEPPLYI